MREAPGETMNDTSETPAPAGTPAKKRSMPEIRTIAVADIMQSLTAGLRDFQAAPLYGLTFGVLYAIGGWAILYNLVAYDVSFMIYPLASGFALVAPFIAAGLYEVSRAREAGEGLTWGRVFGAVLGQTRRELGWMALVTTFMFFIWLEIAIILYVVVFGLSALNLPQMMSGIFGSLDGALFLLIGNVIGAFLGIVCFSLTAVSFPLLLDRNVDFITAMITSVQAVTRNPRPMLMWAFLIAMLSLVSVASVFIALIVVLPVLGHATWHVYRKVVVPEGGDVGGDVGGEPGKAAA